MQEDSGLTVCTGENHTEICLGPQRFDVVPRCCAKLDPLGLQQQTKARSTFASSNSKCLSTSFISLRCLCGTVPKEFKRFVKGSPCCLCWLGKVSVWHFSQFVFHSHRIQSSSQISIDLCKSNNLSGIYGRVRIAGIAFCSMLIIACSNNNNNNNNKLHFRGII